MICENCKQRPATVTVTVNRDGEQIIKHYCDVCSGQNDFVNQEANPTSLDQVFSSWFGMPAWSTDAPKKNEQQMNQVTCKQCGMTYHQFLHDGKFNCPSCYDAFHEELSSIFKKIHNGATEHTGKVPSGINQVYQLKKQIESLRQDMKALVQNEQFEEAAVVRDEIRELENRILEGGGSNEEV